MGNLSEVKIWDDLLDDRFLLDLDEESNYYNWNLTNIANRYSFPHGNKGSHLIFGVNFDVNYKVPENLTSLYKHLETYLLQDKFNLNHIQLNLQTMGLNGTAHYDGTNKDYTLMVFINYKWNKEWGGEFQLLESIFEEDLNPNFLDIESLKNSNHTETILKSIDYKPGRIILFPGDIAHRGLAPNKPYIFRKSLVYRLSLK